MNARSFLIVAFILLPCHVFSLVLRLRNHQIQRNTRLNWGLSELDSMEILLRSTLDHALFQTTSLLSDSQVDLSGLATKLENSANSVLNSDLLKDLEQMDATEKAFLPTITETAISEETSSLLPLGKDFLIFLIATIVIIPLFKTLKASPVIGFLAAGLMLGPAGLNLFNDLSDMGLLAEFGVSFLLFEQGLELTIERLQSLSKYAFGMGTLQVCLTTLLFAIFPFVGGVPVLEFLGSKASLVDITRVDEAVVIGAALALSSSAFVLKILQEKGQLSTKFGAASLGVLLFQDIAVVPLLVLLPIIETNTQMPLSEQVIYVGAIFLKALVGFGGIVTIGGRLVRFLFSVVAQTKSSEAFVGLCLLVALGTGALTDQLGLSSTLGAFTAGALLAESNFRNQIETDIKPFRGILLALFFMTTGASVEPVIIEQEWPTVVALTAGLVAFKSTIVTALGPFFGLTLPESVRTGLLLSGGGEFAFIVLTLGDRLNVIPDRLAKILVGVVVISMAITPYLSIIGDKAADFLEKRERKARVDELTGGAGYSSHEFEGKQPIVICGYGYIGEAVAQLLLSPAITNSLESAGSEQLDVVAFDLDPNALVKGATRGHRVVYGDGSLPETLSTAGIDSPRAFIVTYQDGEECGKAVERLRAEFPTVPILTRIAEMGEYFHIMDAGSTVGVPDEREAALRLSEVLLDSLGGDSKLLSRELRETIETKESEDLATHQLAKLGSSSLQSTAKVASPDKKESSTATIMEDVKEIFKGVYSDKVFVEDKKDP